MATLLHHNAVFIHVPKTGGTYLRRLFVALDLVRFDFARDHADLERVLHTSRFYPGNYLLRSWQLKNDLERVVQRSFKFCFVRRPYEWYASYWRFMQDLGWPQLSISPNRSKFGFRYDPWHPFAAIEPLGDPDFNVFMERVLQTQPGYLTQLFRRYTGANQMDFVGKQETLEQDMLLVFQHMGYPFVRSDFQRVGKVNQSREETPAWAPSLRSAVYELEREVFEKYGYEP